MYCTVLCCAAVLQRQIDIPAYGTRHNGRLINKRYMIETILETIQDLLKDFLSLLRYLPTYTYLAPLIFQL
ncbi:hypothetical protein EYC80_008780 [Monilinia laxa]|uniref:Uncharacterized protein n=1 Tax=Monilinia laxa TaxID=61186 RepID=A0A5N6K1C9_MONLA|nr:hypothetical protein EYC80_008780 [Monilinia laxa]